jgi:hypothetical protein
MVGCQNSWYSAQRDSIQADYAAGRLSPAEYYQAVAMYDKLDADRNAAAFSNYNQLQQTQAQQQQVDLQAEQLREQRRARQFTPYKSGYESGSFNVTDEKGNTSTYQYNGYRR